MKINEHMTPYAIPSGLHSIIGDTLRPGGLDLTKKAADYCGFSINDKIIDIGCGFGSTLEFLHKNYNSAVYGIDLHIPKSLNMFSLFEARAEELPFTADSFNGVFCECVLSLLSCRGKALSEFYRVLQKAGFLVISDIYLRNPKKLSIKNNAHAATCLSGALSREEVIGAVQYSGFDILWWEDHSDSLAQLTAKIVWELGSLDTLMNIMLPGNCSVEHGKAMRNSRPGYFLMIAQKKDKVQHKGSR